MLKKLAEEKFPENFEGTARSLCKNVEKVDEAYVQNEHFIDVIEPIVISLNDSSSSEDYISNENQEGDDDYLRTLL